MYCRGGRFAGVLGLNEAYNPTTNGWTALPSLRPRSGLEANGRHAPHLIAGDWALGELDAPVCIGDRCEGLLSPGVRSGRKYPFGKA